MSNPLLRYTAATRYNTKNQLAGGDEQQHGPHQAWKAPSLAVCLRSRPATVCSSRATRYLSSSHESHCYGRMRRVNDMPSQKGEAQLGTTRNAFMLVCKSASYEYQTLLLAPVA